MNRLPKLSIVTPSFNQAVFIEEAIRSVQTQEYPNFEHIIIDNCSTDGTIEKIKKYPDVKWVSEPDEGQSDALNKGFAMASGEIIGWLNADDIYLPGTFSKIVSLLEDDSVDAVYSNCYFVDKNLSIQKKLITHVPVKWLSLFHCFIPSTTFFFKRSVVESNIFIDKKFHIAMDKEFFAHILYENFKIVYADDFFAKFRWHETNKSNDTREVQQIRYREGLTILNRYAGFRLPDNQLGVLLYKYISNSLLLYRKSLKLKHAILK